jgi:hypothetical protein
MHLARKHGRQGHIKPALLWGIAGLLFLASLARVSGWPYPSSGASRSAVVISELMAAPLGLVQDGDEQSADWFELYNQSNRTVNLLGWSLTDDPAVPDKWRLPDVHLAPGEYLTITASGQDRVEAVNHDGAGANSVPSQPLALHTSFKLAGTGGQLALFDNTSRRFLDASIVAYPPQVPGKSYGLCADNSGYCYLDAPSPGMSNSESTGWRGMAAPVSASPQRGFYQSPVRVTLSTETPGATIRYTLDGSAPTESVGMTYEAPIEISSTAVLRAAAFKPEYLASGPITHSYIFVQDVTVQSAQPSGMPATWGTHRIDMAGNIAGTPVIADYEMDPAIAADTRYSTMLRDGLLSLPTVSLVTDLANLDIYFEDPQARGVESERPVSVEWISPDGAESGFQANAGMRIQGGVGRWEYMPKHSVRLFFRQEYGPGKLSYPVFPDSHVKTFDTLVLRAGANRSFVGVPDEYPPASTTYGRDEWLRRSQIDTFGFGAHGRFVHLYLNGLYWGLYNLVERPDDDFAASYFGGDEQDWYSASQGGSVSGPIDRFQVLRDLAQQGNLSDPKAYATMLEFIDPVQFSDYLIVNWFAGNEDWPDNNWYVNVSYPAGQNLFFVWDGESTWTQGANIRLGPDDGGHTFFPNVVKRIFLALMENADFRMTLADRFFKLTADGGALADDAALARWNTIMDEIEPGVVAESARWGDVRREPPISLEDWYAARQDVAAQMDGNAARLISLAREVGYYPSFDPPAFSPAASAFEHQLTLSMDAPAGVIYFTTDGTDPREAVTGVPSASARRYSTPLVLTTTTPIKARVQVDGVWSALHEADFIRTDEPTGVRFTELMYHPRDGEVYEFIELTNVGGIDIDLSSAFFDGIDLQFDRFVRLPAGQSIVISPDFAAYRERYPTAPIRAIYGGSLSNSGETITLFAADGTVLASVAYDDENGWPLTADGQGDSLELLSATADPNRPASWRASNELHGTPGTSGLVP